MINSKAKDYGYYLFDSIDEYGQSKLSEDIQGTIKIAIYENTLTTVDNIKYLDGDYIGLTFNKDINDKYVIQYGAERLKVKYVIPTNRYNQVFLSRM